MEKRLSEAFTEYRRLLRDFQDLLRGDFRRPREEEPPIRIDPPSGAGAALRGGRAGAAWASAGGPLPRSGAGGVSGPAAPGKAAEGHPEAAPRKAGAAEGRGAAALLADLAEEVRVCGLCPLAAGRNRAVPGDGVPEPLVLVIGEGPGGEEDLQGLPFVGPAGRYLDKWLEAVGMSRKTDVFITNVVKCRPPGNRDPQPQETAACAPFLERQRDILRPRAVLALGRVAAQTLLGESRGIGALRGTVHRWKGLPLVATYHPSAVLRDPSLRRSVWEDLKRLQELVGPRDLRALPKN